MRYPWRFLLILAAASVAVVAAAAAGWRYARVAAPAGGPIILISIDALRADHLPVYGYQGVSTPAIDSLAADGVVFERAYAHSPETLPSHTSILSGRLPFETGVRGTAGFEVPRDVRLVQQILGDRGFSTGAVVSSYLLRRETGLARGFDFFDDEMPCDDASPAGCGLERDGLVSAGVAAQWVKSIATPRFFLFFHVNEPQALDAAPPASDGQSSYDDRIARADEVVGRLLDVLKARSFYDRSLIILVSDHGEGLGDHGEAGHGLFVYEEAIRVPLIVKLPRDSAHARRITSAVQHVDLVPTIADLAGAPRQSKLRGRSLRELVEGNSTTLEDRPIYAEAFYSRLHFGWSELVSLRDGRYQFIRAPREELYDLQQDPAERHDIAADHPEICEPMRAELDRLLGRTAVPAPVTISADERERLAALGYGGVPPVVASEVPADSLPDPKTKGHLVELYRRAQALAAERHYGEAAALLRRILSEDPGLAEVWVGLALTLQNAGRAGDAVEAYKRAVALRASDLNSLLAAGALLLRQGKLSEAKSLAERAVAVAPARAHDLLARVALQRGDLAAATDEAKLAQQADPGRPLPLYVEGVHLHQIGRYDAAIAPLLDAIKLTAPPAPQLADLHLRAAETLVKLERYPEAEAQFKDEIRAFPRNTRARAGLVMLYRATGRTAEAEEAIESLVRTSPTAEGFSLAARLWTALGDEKRAAEIRARARHEAQRLATGQDAPRAQH